MTTDIIKVTNFFKLLSDPTRLKIIDLLLNEGRVCVRDIASRVDMSHSSVSHQLSKLEMKNIVSCEREGQTMCYEILNDNLKSKLREQIKSASM